MPVVNEIDRLSVGWIGGMKTAIGRQLGAGSVLGNDGVQENALLVGIVDVIAGNGNIAIDEMTHVNAIVGVTMVPLTKGASLKIAETGGHKVLHQKKQRYYAINNSR